MGLIVAFGYIPVAVKLPQTYRFKLSDREFASAWLREYYRRPGVRAWRVLSGPGIFILGALTAARADELFMRGIGGLAVLLGLWLTAKPFLMVWAMTSRRRRTDRANVEIEVRFDRDGMRVSDGGAQTAFPWTKLSAAGASSDYVWIELASGNRATIPKRAIDDLDALQTLLASRLSWHG